MIDTSGTTFLFRLIEETGASVPDLTRAWLVAREVFDMPAFWHQVEGLEGQVGIAAQITLLLEGRKLTERAVRWLLHHRRPPFDIQATVGFFADGVRTVRSRLPKLLTGRDLAGFEERRDSYLDLGVPLDLAERVAAMVPTYSAFDIVQVAASAGRGIEETAEVYFDLADRLQITRLRDRITALPREDRWSTMARAALRDDLYAAHASLTVDVLGVSGPRCRVPRGAARRVGVAQRVGGGDGRPDPRRDLGERALHVHHLVGGPAGRPHPGGRQLAARCGVTLLLPARPRPPPARTGQDSGGIRRLNRAGHAYPGAGSGRSLPVKEYSSHPAPGRSGAGARVAPGQRRPAEGFPRWPRWIGVTRSIRYPGTPPIRHATPINRTRNRA